MGGAIEMTERNGTFVLGLGAQKAGSSWLHAQLNHRRDAEFGFLKEYHIHDALTLPEAGFSNRRKPISVLPVVGDNKQLIGLLRLHDLVQAGLA